MLYYLHGKYFFVGNCAGFFVLLVLTADKNFFLFKIEIKNKLKIYYGKFFIDLRRVRYCWCNH